MEPMKNGLIKFIQLCLLYLCHVKQLLFLRKGKTN